MMLGARIDGGSSWSWDDNKAFEKALAIYTDENAYRWEKIAAVIPGKTIEQVVEHYKILVQDVMMIESGCVSLPDYGFSKETNAKELNIQESGNNRKREHKQKGELKMKQRRRKGVAWTENEHRQFLLGLEEYGKGDWRSISRNYVVTRTPTQVASHAQKHFARLNSKDKTKNNRPSIYDTTWQNTQATSQPSLDLPIYGRPSIRNTHGTSSQPSLDRPIHDTPTIWNLQATLQPSVNVLSYGTATPTPTIGQSMVRPVHLPFGNDHMNGLAPSLMAYGVQHHSTPHHSVSSAPINMGSILYNMAYTPQSCII